MMKYESNISRSYIVIYRQKKITTQHRVLPKAIMALSIYVIVMVLLPQVLSLLYNYNKAEISLHNSI